jgi:hypothetical protein
MKRTENIWEVFGFYSTFELHGCGIVCGVMAEYIAALCKDRNINPY